MASRICDKCSIKLDTITISDCIIGLRQIEEESIDLIITDPPFGINYNPQSQMYNRKSNFVIDGYKEVSKDYYGFTIDWLHLAIKALKPNGSIYIYCAWNKVYDVMRAIDDLSLYIRNHLIWKKSFGVYCSIRWVSSHYHLLHIVKSESIRPTFVKVYKKHPKKGGLYHYPEDVLMHNTEYHSKTPKIGTKLPNKQVELLIRTSSHKGDIVLDPFVGNGTVPIAAKKLKRRYIGFEINSNAQNIIRANGLTISKEILNID